MIEATAERDLRSKLEREGFRVFSIASSGQRKHASRVWRRVSTVA